jgi:hypothetical protein
MLLLKNNKISSIEQRLKLVYAISTALFTSNKDLTNLVANFFIVSGNKIEEFNLWITLLYYSDSKGQLFIRYGNQPSNDEIDSAIKALSQPYHELLYKRKIYPVDQFNTAILGGHSGPPI